MANNSTILKNLYYEAKKMGLFNRIEDFAIALDYSRSYFNLMILGQKEVPDTLINRAKALIASNQKNQEENTKLVSESEAIYINKKIDHENVKNKNSNAKIILNTTLEKEFGLISEKLITIQSSVKVFLLEIAALKSKTSDVSFSASVRELEKSINDEVYNCLDELRRKNESVS